jgi:hypothetical protein
VAGRRWVRTEIATTTAHLPGLVLLVHGWTCDVARAVLDDQTAKLHLPLCPPTERPRGPEGVAGELVVGRVAEFCIVGATGRRRNFDLDALLYETSSGRLSIRSPATTEFVVAVDQLAVALRLTMRGPGGRRR